MIGSLMNNRILIRKIDITSSFIDYYSNLSKHFYNTQINSNTHLDSITKIKREKFFSVYS